MNSSSNPDIEDVTRETSFPGEFLEAMLETAWATLDEYLRANGAPAAASDCLRDLVFVKDLAAENPDTWRPTGRKGWNAEVDEAVKRLIWEIRLLGGVFHGPYSESRSKGTAKWGGCDETPDES
jgi:hypothetical protein